MRDGLCEAESRFPHVYSGALPECALIISIEQSESSKPTVYFHIGTISLCSDLAVTSLSAASGAIRQLSHSATLIRSFDLRLNSTALLIVNEEVNQRSTA